MDVVRSLKETFLIGDSGEKRLIKQGRVFPVNRVFEEAGKAIIIFANSPGRWEAIKEDWESFALNILGVK